MNHAASRSQGRDLLTLVLLLLAVWGTRLYGLEALPLHNDEGLHLTRALEVWRGHPFWEISDGKIINHWLIALFYPQHAPVFAARVATVFVALPGLAAGYALSRRAFGRVSALLAGIFWLTTPYLFFYERLAQSDVQAGALLVVTLWAALRFAESGRGRFALLTGLALALAGLFKLSAAPFALMVALIFLLLGRLPLARRVTGLGIVAGVGLASFALPLAYLWVRTGQVFEIALGWIGLSGEGGGPLFAHAGGNFSRLLAQFTGEGAVAWGAGIALGLAGVLLARREGRPAFWRSGLLLLAALLPMLPMLLLATDVEPRHFVVGLPLLLVFAGSGWGVLINRLAGGQPRRWALAALLGLALVVQTRPFVQTASTDPGRLTLPPQMARQFLTDHSSGFGLREAMLALPEMARSPDSPLIAVMFRDSCRRANFYAPPGYGLDCPDFPGMDAIRAALAEDGPVYVLQDRMLDRPDLEALSPAAAIIARYPRPGESPGDASVVLWRLE